MRVLKYIPLSLMLLFVVFWLGSIIKVEVLTWEHISEFSIPDEVIAWTGEWDNAKIINYTDKNASIYGKFGSLTNGTGDSVSFSKENDDWQYKSWGTLWSTSGSADDFVWPYFYHSSEGRALFIILGSPVLLISIFTLYRGNKNKKTYGGV